MVRNSDKTCGFTWTGGLAAEVISAKQAGFSGEGGAAVHGVRRASLCAGAADLFTLGIGCVPLKGTRSVAVGETYGPGAVNDIRPSRGRLLSAPLPVGFTHAD
jgi:hypothetical protein